MRRAGLSASAELLVLLGKEVSSVMVKLKECVSSTNNSICEELIQLQGTCEAVNSIVQLTQSTDDATHRHNGPHTHTHTHTE